MVTHILADTDIFILVICPMKKILEKTLKNDQCSSFYSKKTQERDHFYEKFFIGLAISVLDNCINLH